LILPSDALCFLTGDNTPLIRQSISAKVEKFLKGEPEREIACEKYVAGPEDSDEEKALLLGKILESLRTPPILTQKKAIVLEGALISAKGPAGQEGQAGLFASVLAAALEARYPLLFIFWTEEPWDPGALGLPKDRFTAERHFLRDGRKTLGARARERLRSSQKQIDPALLEEWIERTRDEAEFWGSVDQVMTALGREPVIRRKDIEPYLAFNYDAEDFALWNALDRRDPGKLLQLSHQYLEIDGQEPERVLGSMVSYFIQLRAARELLERTGAPAKRFAGDREGLCQFPPAFFDRLREAAREGAENNIFKKHPYGLKILFSSAMRCDGRRIGDIFDLLRRADSELKTRNMSPAGILEKLMVRMGETWKSQENERQAVR
jgi:DNA polymerase III delta subunit